MAATTVTFNQTSPFSSVANSMSTIIPVAAGTTYNFAYQPSTTSNGRGAQIWLSLVSGSYTAANLVPLVVKWEDRAAVQGYVNPQWICSVTGPVDIVLEKSNDMTATYYQFS